MKTIFRKQFLRFSCCILGLVVLVGCKQSLFTENKEYTEAELYRPNIIQIQMFGDLCIGDTQ